MHDAAHTLVDEVLLDKEAGYDEWFAGKVRATQARLEGGSTTTKEHDAAMLSVWERVLLKREIDDSGTHAGKG